MKNKALLHEDRLIPYEIQHKPNVTRRIHLRAANDGSLMVIAPRRMSKLAIHKTLQERVSSVARFLEKALDRLREIPHCEYIDGEEHLYLGESHPLKMVLSAGRSSSIRISEGKIRIRSADNSPARIQRLLQAWYRKQAGPYFAAQMERIARDASWVNGNIPPVRLRKMKRTWGSCSARGTITLNPQLMKTPPNCIDYVIAHELCHLKEMNHGKAFYALQRELYPGWREARDHLHSRAHVYLQG